MISPMRPAVPLMLLAIAIAAAGCAGSPPGAATARDNYADAYGQGMGLYGQGQDFFNSGTAAWENASLRDAAAAYANASAAFDAASAAFDAAARFSGDARDQQFAQALGASAFNMSRAADDFRNAAGALLANDTGRARALFDDGTARGSAGDEALNRSIDLTPGWLASY